MDGTTGPDLAGGTRVRAGRLPVRPSRGALLGLAAFAAFAAADATVKALTERVSVFEAVGATSATALAALAVAGLLMQGPRALIPKAPGLAVARGALLAGDTILIITGFSMLPLAEAYALAFVAPVLVLVMAGLLLGEPVGWKGWLSVAIGFAGVLAVVRPGFASVSIGHAAALASAAAFAGAMLMVRRMPADESDGAITATAMAVLATITAPFALFGASAFPPTATMLAVVAGILLAAAHLLVVKAFRQAPSRVVAPLQYTQIPWALAYGVLFFGDVADGWTLAGTAAVVVAGLLALR